MPLFIYRKSYDMNQNIIDDELIHQNYFEKSLDMAENMLFSFIVEEFGSLKKDYILQHTMEPKNKLIVEVDITEHRVIYQAVLRNADNNRYNDEIRLLDKED